MYLCQVHTWSLVAPEEHSCWWPGSESRFFPRVKTNSHHHPLLSCLQACPSKFKVVPWLCLCFHFLLLMLQAREAPVLPVRRVQQVRAHDWLRVARQMFPSPGFTCALQNYLASTLYSGVLTRILLSKPPDWLLSTAWVPWGRCTGLSDHEAFIPGCLADLKWTFLTSF